MEFEFKERSMDESEERGLSEKVKALVISGFLGAGKTTLLKNVLSWETGLSDTVVIVNEFGDVGIDGSLLKGARSGVVELAGGCICCTMQTDLKKTLNRVLDEFRPRRILIEATGVADPKAITETIRNAEFIERMEIERVVTVLESDFWDERDDMGSFYLNQLREADLILLNKIDRMEEEEIHRFLKEVHEVIPGSRILPTVHCHLDPESLWTQYDGNEKELKAGQFFPVRNSTPSDKNGDHQWHKDHESENAINMMMVRKSWDIWHSLLRKPGL